VYHQTNPLPESQRGKTLLHGVRGINHPQGEYLIEIQREAGMPGETEIWMERGAEGTIHTLFIHFPKLYIAPIYTKHYMFTTTNKKGPFKLFTFIYSLL
jgi:hypothetical protein